MEKVKHDAAAAKNSVKRYESPRSRVVLLKAQGVLCGSLDGTPSNNPWTSGSDSAYGFGDED